jgi:hypothetical protein
MAPPGTKVVIHEKPAQRGTWATHGVRGWYIGPAPEHYQCFKTYANKTAAAQISDTVELFPAQCPMPRLSSMDTAIKAALGLTDALRNQTPAAPFAKLGEERLAALQQLATIFRTSVTQPSPRVPTPEKKVAKPLPRVSQPDQLPQSPAAHQPRYHTRLQERLQHINHVHTTRQPAPMLVTPENNGIHPFPMANAVTNPKQTGVVQEYCQLIANLTTHEVWLHAAANEFGRLAQGIKDHVKGTNKIKCIRHSQVPAGRTVIYARLCANIWPQKEETHQCRITVGGDRIDYPGKVSTKTAGLTTIKLLLNSVLVSKPVGRFMTADKKNFYLNTPLGRHN